MRRKPQEARAGEVMRREGESINMFQEVKLHVRGQQSGLSMLGSGLQRKPVDGRHFLSLSSFLINVGLAFWRIPNSFSRSVGTGLTLRLSYLMEMLLLL